VELALSGPGSRMKEKQARFHGYRTDHLCCAEAGRKTEKAIPSTTVGAMKPRLNFVMKDPSMSTPTSDKSFKAGRRESRRKTSAGAALGTSTSGKPATAQDRPKTTEELVRRVRDLREKLQSDPHRPTYHFMAPEGSYSPFDANGAMYWKGRYHLFYIFQKLQDEEPREANSWGHASSIDLVHWVHHPTALAPAPGDPERGIHSGGAFLNKEGVPTIIYLGVDAGACIATSEDDELITWNKSPQNPVIPMPKKEDTDYDKYIVGDACAWVEGDAYYAVLGDRVPPVVAGGAAYLFTSRDLIHWKYLHPLYENERQWTETPEDCSCPDFFPLGDTHMLLFISHYTGAQYYLGRYEGEKFYPERHGRMNWRGGPLFAPESLLDGNGRRIFWAWACESRTFAAQAAAGWSGVMSLPRILSMAGDGTLQIEPVPELQILRRNHRRRDRVKLDVDSEVTVGEAHGDCLELAVEMAPSGAHEFGVKVRCSPDGAEQTVISCAPSAKTLSVDTTRSSLSEDVIQPWPYPFGLEETRKNIHVPVQVAPFELPAGERLELRIFLDRSVLEVFANRRQCVTQRIYPSRSDSLEVRLFSRGGTVEATVEVWDLARACS
jgi:sucrose-6-phosphate hydrolase SacC (GH32 family)